ncbi:flagellar basal body rod protein FlgC [Pseudoalteromonas xiamenensis]|uniref:Flagellar basal-body rod protein FlgC n=1 Tax=Pseudoalteromonas xiamenensis TaxID=882626 RepID=A0A975HKH2_9GAMM|nr:flagellar basal body rod protein FlgC [Pseudoalteromonas xiamenensis]QTH71018.1 flagellar basal body rod protein FlgC [Pseudoalteromonas xiamenensis]
MSLYNVFDIATTGMSAQNIRLNTTASNISNANSISSSQDKVYRARHPVFAAELNKAATMQRGNEVGSSVGVKVLGIVESDKPLQIEYNPNHPSADENGYIYKPNVNVVEEMANMISASRSYQTNVQVADAAKQMLTKTLQLGQR